jgi:hypothetical protein
LTAAILPAIEVVVEAEHVPALGVEPVQLLDIGGDGRRRGIRLSVPSTKCVGLSPEPLPPPARKDQRGELPAISLWVAGEWRKALARTAEIESDPHTSIFSERNLEILQPPATSKFSRGGGRILCKLSGFLLENFKA